MAASNGARNLRLAENQAERGVGSSMQQRRQALLDVIVGRADVIRGRHRATPVLVRAKAVEKNFVFERLLLGH
jgi:hypothetical protein